MKLKSIGLSGCFDTYEGACEYADKLLLPTTIETPLIVLGVYPSNVVVSKGTYVLISHETVPAMADMFGMKLVPIEGDKDGK